MEGADGVQGDKDDDMKLTEKEVAAFRGRFLRGEGDIGTLTQAAAAVAPTNPNALKSRQNAFKGLASLGLVEAGVAIKIEGGS